VVDEERMRPVGDFPFEVSALSFLWCFDLVGWLTGGSSSLQIPVPLTPKGSLPEQVEEETEQEMVKPG